MPHHRVVISGTNAVPDLFNMSFSVNAAPASDADATAAAVKAAFDSQWTVVPAAGRSFANCFHSSVKFEKITVYERGLSPVGPSDDVAEALLTGKTGTQPGDPLPPECAVCVSLRTGHPGRRWRGRMFLPALHTSCLGAGGTIADQTRDSLAQWAAAFFGDINDGLKFVCVWSRTDLALRHVTEVAVGSQFDVITRRQNSAPESYKTVSVSQV